MPTKEQQLEQMDWFKANPPPGLELVACRWNLDGTVNLTHRPAKKD